MTNTLENGSDSASSFGDSNTLEKPFWIRSLRFNDGTELELPSSGVVVLVGANNVGKSQALRNIGAQVGLSAPLVHVVVAPQIELASDREAAVRWFAENCSIKSLASGDFYESRGHRAAVTKIEGEIRGGGALSARLGKLVSIFANAEERLRLTVPVEAVDIVEAQPEHPIHILAQRADLLEQISRMTKGAFGDPLTLDLTAGRMVMLRLGVPSSDPEFSRHGVPGRDYITELRALPTLGEQGHGIRCYTGMLMELLAVNHTVVLIDEPEAFLHPPQAELIGRAISDIKHEESQVFVATHDANVLKGFLSSSKSENVTIVRIGRSGDKNPVAVLRQKDLEQLWSNPALRYSNVLDGIFSEGTVVCEGDPDCRLYESATDALDDMGASGLNFTHGGGVGRVPAIVAALSAVSVPTAVVIDLDVLGKADHLRAIVESLGHEWKKAWDKLLNTLEAGVQTLAETPSKATIVKAVEESLAETNEEDSPPADALKRISKVARKTGGWSKLKKGGSQMLPSGACTNAYRAIRKILKGQGVFVVDVGELEGWFPTVGNHGPAHVYEVLEQDLMDGEDAKSVKEFMAEVRGYLSSGAA